MTNADNALSNRPGQRRTEARLPLAWRVVCIADIDECGILIPVKRPRTEGPVLAYIHGMFLIPDTGHAEVDRPAGPSPFHLGGADR